jgi:hypothetical protein
MSRLFRALRRRPQPIVIAVAALLSVGAASAGATSAIEGVWSFNGGEVAIKPVAGGKFEGIVVAPTKFAECTHQPGEHMWTEITPQADGSFWGLHQWLFEKICAANPTRGATAWRVQRTANGTRYLEVCFSEPGKGQPTIAPNGTSANVSYGCAKSSPTAPLPVVVSPGRPGAPPASRPTEAGTAEQVTFANTVLLPRAGGCVARGTLTIKIVEPKRDPLKEVVVRIKKRKLADVRGVKRLERSLVLRHLPRGTYTLTIVATTVLDQKLLGARTYHSCGRTSHRVRLHRPRHHRRRH